MSEFFRRVEKKYLINEEQYRYVKGWIENRMVEDCHGKSKICNIYWDSPQYELIRHSIQKPMYKDKIRLRSYGVPTLDSKVYLEVKRKFNGVVSKRRIELLLKNFYRYKNQNILSKEDLQIRKELDYYFQHYNLEPTMFISYDRRAFYDKEDSNFRLTFDSQIIARDYELKLEKGSYGKYILESDKYIMEVKTLGAIPMWFVEALSEKGIYPCGFSKYGEAYTQIVLGANELKKYII